MAARSSWSGAISLGGFPVPVKAYPMVRSRSSQSFKTLCGCHNQPIVAPRVCAVSGEVPDVTHSGHEVTKGSYVVIPDEAVETIKSAGRSEVLAISQLTSRGDLPIHLANAQYRLVPNDKVPGADQPVQIVWNGLHANDLAIVTEWTPRAGSRDSILAIYADDEGLIAVQLPFLSELNETPAFTPAADAEQAQMFVAFMEQQSVETREFAYDEHESQYQQRRDAAITAALSGEPITAEAPADTSATPDLMAAMKSALANTKAPAEKKTPAKKRAPKKDTAKA